MTIPFFRRIGPCPKVKVVVAFLSLIRRYPPQPHTRTAATAATARLRARMVGTEPSLLSALVANPESALASGELAFLSGNTYVGELDAARGMHGAGKYTWAPADGSEQGGGKVTYAGALSSNAITGRGVYTWADGSTYTGDVVDGVRHGVGTFVAAGGYPRYQGEWREGLRHGRGLLTYDASGNAYDGQWVADAREGLGTLTHGSGNTYVGEWEADRKCGRGTMEWVDRRERYAGEWYDGKPHGVGEHEWLRLQARHLQSQP